MRIVLILLIMMPVCKPFAQNVDNRSAVATIDFIAQTIENVHVNPFKYCGRDHFYNQLEILKGSLKDSVDKVDLCNNIQKSIALLSDGHTQLFMPNKDWEDHIDNNGRIIPIEFGVTLSGKVVVNKCFDESSIVTYGDEILEINGIDVNQIISHEKYYISAESEVYLNQRLGSRMPSILWSKHNVRSDSFDVKCKRGDSVFVVKMKAVEYQATTKGGEANYAFEIEEGVGVLTLNLMYDSDIKFRKFAKSAFKQMREEGIANLIIDFRYNDGGDSNIGDELLKYITNEPFKTYKQILVKKSSEMEVFYKDYFGALTYSFIKLFLPYLKLEDGEIKEYEGEEMFPRKKTYQGNVYLLTSNQTYSSADMFVRIFQNYKVGTIIGEETGGKGIDFGEIITVKVPKIDAYFDISCKEFYDVGEYENSGVRPDVEVNEKDALDMARELIKKEKISLR